jgi:hypothetical protein
MQNNIISLLIPLAIIGGGIYVKNNPDKEPHATPTTWKKLVIAGSILFVIRVIFLIIG